MCNGWSLGVSLSLYRTRLHRGNLRMVPVSEVALSRGLSSPEAWAKCRRMLMTSTLETAQVQCVILDHDRSATPRRAKTNHIGNPALTNVHAHAEPRGRI